MYQGDTQQVGEPYPDIAGIGVVAVDERGHATLLLQPLCQVVAETLQVIPQLFLGDVLLRPAGNTHDLRACLQGLDLPGVLRVDGGVLHQAGDQVDPVDVGVPGQRPGQVDHVLGLAAGIGVAPQLEIGGADQAVYAD